MNTDPNNTEEVTPTEPVDLTAGAIAALDEGLASEAPAEPVEPVDPVEPKAVEPVAGDKPAEPAAPAPEKDVDAEIAELGLKEKSAARFRELTDKVKAVKEAGISDFAELPRIIERAKFADDLETAIVNTGASPEQYGSAINYLALVNSGDPVKMTQALEIMQSEQAALAKMLGREIPGIHDPLADHEDLREEVENGDITRKRAIEIAQQRASQTMQQGRQEVASTEAAKKAEFDGAIASLNTLGASLKAADPAYASKIAALKPAIELIRETCPPSEWAARVERAYRQVNVPAPTASRPPPGPVRSVTPAGVAMTAEPKSAMDALEMGLNLAAQAR